VDFLTLGAHKFYGPKGVGVLIRPATSSMSPLLHGGNQEHGLRPGTENVALIVGLAEALDLAIQLREETARNASVQRDRIIRFVLERIEGAVLTGHPVQRLPHHASFAFDHLESNALLAALDLEGFACSAGSACKVGDPQPSSVLLAMGLEEPWTLGSLRISLGRATTDEAVDRFCDVLPGIIDRLRAAHIAKVA
jgi:cysteine desulfurase